MKQLLLVSLVCLNAALVVALTYGPTTSKAYGQVIGSNYLVMTGHIYDNNDAIWIIDLRDRKLAALKFDKTRKQLTGIGPPGGRNLSRDFNRRTRR